MIQGCRCYVQTGRSRRLLVVLMMTLRGRKTRKDQNGQRDNDGLVQLAQPERSHALHNSVSLGSLVECIKGERQRNEENFIDATVIDIMSGMLRRNENQIKTYSQLSDPLDQDKGDPPRFVG